MNTWEEIIQDAVETTIPWLENPRSETPQELSYLDVATLVEAETDAVSVVSWQETYPNTAGPYGQPGYLSGQAFTQWRVTLVVVGECTVVYVHNVNNPQYKRLGVMDTSNEHTQKVTRERHLGDVGDTPTDAYHHWGLPS